MSIFNRRNVSLVLCLCLGLSVAAAAASNGEYRTWSDSTGKFALRAKLDAVRDGKAVLITEKGETRTIPIEKLSKADQDYIAEQNVDNPFKKEGNATTDSSADADESVQRGPRTVQVNWSQSEAVSLATGNDAWNVPLPEAPDAKFRPKSVPLEPKRDFFEDVTGVAVSRVAKMAVVGYAMKRREPATLRFVLCDIERGRVKNTIAMTGDNMMPMALSDDGERLLVRRNDFGFGNQGRLEIWIIKDGSFIKSLSWKPYDGDRGSSQDVRWAEFLDAKRLATSSAGGKIAIWDVVTGQPICHIQASHGSVPALSADRRLMAIVSDSTLGIFDVEKREMVASQKTPCALRSPVVAFSPSGKKIGCVATDRILVWDTAAGNLEKNFVPAGLAIHGAIDFPNEDFILANSRYLIELKNQLKLWHYRNTEFARTVQGTTFVVVSGRHQGGLLLAVKLPHSEALRTLEAALKQPNLFVFHKGTPVKLDVSGIPDPDERKKAEKALTEKLAAMDCRIDDSAPVTVVASIDGPKPRIVVYMHAGTHKVTEYFTRLKFVYEDQTLWETSHTNISRIIRLRPGDNIESYLRRASAKPNYQLYQSVAIPEFLQKPSKAKGRRGGDTIGASDLSVNGVE